MARHLQDLRTSTPSRLGHVTLSNGATLRPLRRETLLGLVYGEAASRSGGIRWAAPAHMVTDYLDTDLAWFSELDRGATRTGSLSIRQD